jgi:CDP-diacylglycerol pyrophosphatase
MIKKNIPLMLTAVLVIIVAVAIILVYNRTENIAINKDSLIHIDNKQLIVTNAENKNVNITRNINVNTKIIILKNDTQIYSCSSNKKQDLMFYDDNLILQIK